MLEGTESLQDRAFIGRADDHEVDIGQRIFVAFGERSVDKSEIDRPGVSKTLGACARIYFISLILIFRK